MGIISPGQIPGDVQRLFREGDGPLFIVDDQISDLAQHISADDDVKWKLRLDALNMIGHIDQHVPDDQAPERQRIDDTDIRLRFLVAVDIDRLPYRPDAQLFREFRRHSTVIAPAVVDHSDEGFPIHRNIDTI